MTNEAGSEPVLRTRGLTKDYGSGRGLFDLDLEIRAGEVFGFLGPNGAGKSTAMRLIMDSIHPTAGFAIVLGFDSHLESGEIHRRVGYLPGDFALYPRLTGAEILGLFAQLRGGVDREVRDALAERFAAQLDVPTGELSTGNRQKIGLIQAFMHEPDLLILDEPIAGLDPLVQQGFHALLAEVAAAGGTVLLSSHTLSEVERVANRVGILREGRLVVVDTLDGLRAVALKQFEIEFAEAAPTTLEQVAGVRDVRRIGTRRVVVSFEGKADPVIKAIAAHDVVSLHSREDDLEEIFLDFYRGTPGR